MTVHTRQQAYADKVLSAKLTDIATGNGGWNKALYVAARKLYQYAGAGLFNTDELTYRLTEAGIAAGNPRNEVRDTLRSAERAAANDPRPTLPDFGSEGTAHIEDTGPTAPHLEIVAPPCAQWQERAGAFCQFANDQLWADAGDDAWDWLTDRGFHESTISRFKLGYNPRPIMTSRAKWGLPPMSDQPNADALALPVGVVIPYYIGGAIWKIEVRRLQPREGEKKYKTIAGSSNALYNADALQPGEPAAICEGAFDVMAIHEAARGLCAPVACGTTTGARRVKWIAMLGACRPVLVTMDTDQAGNDGASYWLGVLGATARRWKALIDDPAAMLKYGMDVRGWILEGLQ